MNSNLLILLMKLKGVIGKFVLKPMRWILWDFLGFHLLFIKIFPRSKKITNALDYKPPSSIGIWLFSIYFAFLGFTTARYERILDRAEFKYNTMTTQLAADVPLDSFRVKEIGRFEIPIEPKIEWNRNFFKDWNFIVTVWNSLTSNKQFYQTLKFKNEVISGYVEIKEAETNDEFLKKIVELWKHKLVSASLNDEHLEGAKLYKGNLEGANLWYANLEGAKLYKANLEGAILARANLKKADLWRANLKEANLAGADLYYSYLKRATLQEANLQRANLQEATLQEANLQEANLQEANLQEANLQEANLQRANLQRANLQEANLQEANLQRANLEGVNFGPNRDAIIDRLSSVYTLYEATGLPTNIKRELKEKHRELFEDPEDR